MQSSARSQCPVNHGQNRLGLSSRRESIPNMKVLGFVILATIFEAVGDVLMRTALQSRYAMAGRIGLIRSGVRPSGFVWTFPQPCACRICYGDRNLPRIVVRHVPNR